MLVLDYLGLTPTTTTDSTTEFITGSFTELSNGSRGSEDAPTNSTTTTTNVSRTWSRRSDVSNTGFIRTNLSFQSSKISSVEQESMERRRTLAKAALAGIPYVSKEQLNLRYKCLQSFFSVSVFSTAVSRNVIELVIEHTKRLKIGLKLD